jgi:hypothetical protein
VKRQNARQDGPNPLEWIETATHLLRSAPAGALLCYYIGSATCLLGLLFFWTDMSRGAFASGHLLESALTAAALYLWMKCWQAVFLSKLRAHLLLEPDAPWTLRRIVRVVIAQATFQPLGLFLRFLAANLLVPYIWTYSLFIGAAILSDGTNPSLHAIARGAFREAGLWWRQTHLALLALLGFAIFIFANVFLVALALPFAVRTFFGIESPFTRDTWSMVNSTFFAAVVAITYLCFDPLRKAVFLVRHFQGASIQSGEDLRVALKTIRQRSRLAVAAALLFAAFLTTPLVSSRADEPAPPPVSASHVESSQLNNSLDRVLEQREYAWRFPRPVADDKDQKSWLGSFLENVGKKIRGWFGSAWERAKKWVRRLFDRKISEQEESSSSSVDWGFMGYAALIVLAAAFVIFVAILLWRARWGKPPVAAAQPVVIVPDLNEESVTADQLPEDGWLQLARELRDKGDLRLAMRAFYLATLAHLGQRELIRLARHKSNHEYDLELQRRARGNAGILDAFDHSLFAFERVWYGEHTATAKTLDDISHSMERIRAC